jgi:outer membrane immunogenic protein
MEGDMGYLSLLHQQHLRLRVHQPCTRDTCVGLFDRLKKLLLAGAGIVALLSEPAGAADLARPAPVYAPPPPPVVAVFTWTGCYVGGNVGGAWVNTHSYDTNGVLTGFAGLPALNGDLGSQTVGAFAGGGQLGCDYQVDRFVFGISGMFDGTSLNASIDQPGGFFTSGPQVPWLATLTARAGVAVTPTGLLYAKAGGAWMKDNFSVGLTQAGAAFLGTLPVPLIATPGTLANVSFTSSGWTAGAGFEWAFNDRVSVFAEYDYMNFSTTTANLVPTVAAVLPVTAFSLGVSHNVNLFTVGVNLRFGPGGF